MATIQNDIRSSAATEEKAPLKDEHNYPDMGHEAAKIEEPEDLPDVQAKLPELKLISHSPIFYWWPVWAVGFLMALVSGVTGDTVQVGDGGTELIASSSNPGIIFIAVILAVVIFTNVKLRGIYSVATVLAILFVAVTLAWLGLWDAIFELIPELSVYMNAGFYLVFSTALFLIWASAFFIFDRLTYWSIRPGQMTEEHWIGGKERSFDTRGMLFEKRGEDLFRHHVLGLGAGDLEITTTGARRETLFIPNVLFVDRKVAAIQKLIAVKPDEVVGHA